VSGIRAKVDSSTEVVRVQPSADATPAGLTVRAGDPPARARHEDAAGSTKVPSHGSNPSFCALHAHGQPTSSNRASCRTDVNGPDPAWGPAHSVTYRLTSTSASPEASSGRPTGTREVGELVGFCRSPGGRAGRRPRPARGRLSSQSPRGSRAVYARWTTSFLPCRTW
jgi:hypothetical protein